MKRDGQTVLMTTHYLSEAEALCDRIAIIHRGKIVATGTPRELIAGSTATPTVELTTGSELRGEWLETIAGIEGLRRDGTKATFRSPTVNATVAALLTALEIRGIDVTELRASEALQRQCAANVIRNRFPVLPPPLAAPRYNHAKLRLAYLSSDVGHHPVATQIVQLIESHDREGFEIIGIGTNQDDGSPQRRRA